MFFCFKKMLFFVVWFAYGMACLFFVLCVCVLCMFCLLYVFCVGFPIYNLKKPTTGSLKPLQASDRKENRFLTF